MKLKRPINDMVPIAEKLILDLKPFCDKVEVAGSIRRQRPEVGDIEIICIQKNINTRKLSI